MRRFRSRRPRRSNRRPWKKSTKIKLVIAGVILLALFLFISLRLRPMIQTVTATVAKQVSTTAIHNTVVKQLQEANWSYEDFVNIQRDSNGNITTIATNMVNINQLKANIALAIQEELGNSYTQTGVPLGTLTGNDLLRGHGPKVPVRISIAGNVSVEMKSNFEAAGINQTRHQIYLEITTSAYSYLTGASTTTDVTTDVAVAETVIVGDVPQMFASFGSDMNLEDALGKVLSQGNPKK